MARAMATDPLHAFRFHVRADPIPGLSEEPLQPAVSIDGYRGVGQQSEAGFQAVTSPELTVESTEYREGLKTYTHKYPGIPTVNDLTFSRGVARADTAFLQWVKAAVEGQEYRTNLYIYHAIREGRSYPFQADIDFTTDNSKTYYVREAFPIRVKIAGDLDASTSDVSLSEIDVAYEKFDVRAPGGGAIV
jgi:phage tail-like protein